MNSLSRMLRTGALLGSAGLAAALLAGADNNARADLGGLNDVIELQNTGGSSSSAGFYTNVLDMQDDSSGTTNGYDAGKDTPLSTYSIYPNGDAQFFVIYSQFGANKVEKNFAQYVHIGDTFHYILSAEDRKGTGFSTTTNTIEFTEFDLSNNLYGVTDFMYELSVDSGLDGDYNNPDILKFGLVSDVMKTPDKNIGVWPQRIAGTFNHTYGDYYGTLTLTATGVPEPTGLGLAGAAGVLGAGYFASQRKRD